ncbi:hypothetical protein [Belliella filtrata]|nr:hypothetical protein [Belliella filtrata]
MNIVNELVSQYGYEEDRLTLRMANVSRNGSAINHFSISNQKVQ